MKVKEIRIINFKCFKGEFTLGFNEDMNIIVGNNEAGKSTIIEALHLALTGYFNGRSIGNDLTQYLFNADVVKEYLASIEKKDPIKPPSINIEVFFEGSDDEKALYLGDGNRKKDKASGISLNIEFNDKFKEEYELLIQKETFQSLPIEYYSATWSTFARMDITTRTIPIKSSLIDSSNHRYQGNSDVYISRIIRNNLEQVELLNISQAHRKMKDGFMKDQSIKSINEKLNSNESLTHKKVQLSVELGTKNAWESSLVAELDSIPFHFVGKGTQCIVKTEIALAGNRAKDAGIILIEEPENHLSHTNLNNLISCIKDKYGDKQIIMTTHSSFVANKLGLKNLILLNSKNTLRFNDVTKSTQRFFEKIAGYDTLRFILCDKAILVEGDSDELVVQKAFSIQNEGMLPIEKGVDIISVGISFLRFLELATKLKKPTVVVTDNDGDIEAVKSKYMDYLGDSKKAFIDICYDQAVDTGTGIIGKKSYNYNTLEPKILKANGLEKLNKVFGTTYSKEDDLRVYMKNNKTECALAIFETSEPIVFPEYILEAIQNNE